jgi:hypothetical protein
VSRPIHRIDEELVCVESFVHHLKEKLSCTNVEIEKEKNDPPDFWITIASKRFAAEVTSIATDQEYSGLCEGLKTSIDKECRERNYLKGKYAIRIFMRPEIPKRNSRDWLQLVNAGVNYIRITMNSPSAEGTRILDVDDGYVVIEKSGSCGDAIGLIGPSDNKWGDEKGMELAQLLQKAIEKKRNAIEKKRVLDVCPNVLLILYDAYGHCDMKEAMKAFQRVSGAEWFHSVYWAASFSNRQNELYPSQPGRSGCFLYSKNGQWMSQQ